MAPTVVLGTPLADALSSIVPPKLVEMGWSQEGADDSALTEYVVLMLVNGKTQEQIADELSNDLLSGEGDKQDVLNFSNWLFEQVENLNRQLNGGAAPDASAQPNQETATAMDSTPGADHQDMQMGDDTGQSDSVYVFLKDFKITGRDTNRKFNRPTGPKSMRNNRQGGRGRILGQINRNLDRSGDSMLHRVRGQQGAGRINTHGRDFGKGPRGQHGQPGPGRMGHGRHMGQMQPGGQMQGNPASNIMQMTPQNQMQFMALLEEQARMMAQFMPGMMPPAVNPAFQQGSSQPQRSLFERVERQQQHSGGNFMNRAAQNGVASQAATRGAGGDHDMDMTSDQAPKDSEQGEANTDSICRFNLRCTKKDCPYAHQSPAAPEGTLVDPTDHCPFGAACKNKKCTGRHPSPAVKSSHQSEEICRFFPHCTNPHCSFKHPSMPLCRNGADCSTAGCKFTHLTTACKFNPCLNRNCPYKHSEGQRGSFPDKVWTADGSQGKDKPHVSERKFIDDENTQEELIKPEASAEAPVSEELIT